ncbi:hypothetical protein K1719_003076 [Acacia pycnantha]|nr:hypothetical protein K1719_003076 [Acacia pycnantha]
MSYFGGICHYISPSSYYYHHSLVMRFGVRPEADAEAEKIGPSSSSLSFTDAVHSIFFRSSQVAAGERVESAQRNCKFTAREKGRYSQHKKLLGACLNYVVGRKEEDEEY